MRIQHNITADNSHRQLGINSRNLGVSTEKLSSGYRVNRAADDAAGLAISEKMRSQIRGLNRASLNIQDGVSLLQVGDGALQFIHNKMQRLRELSVQAANDTNQLLDREAIQLEFGQLTSEINEAVSRTNFNERLLFDGSIGASWEYNLGKITNLPHTATILAGDDYDPVNADVPGWTIPATFGATPTVLNLGAGGFPTYGVFAMQMVTPADGTLNVILDFGVANSAGTMDRDGFLAYFRNGFNSLGLGTVVNDITYNAALSRLEFDFPVNPNSPDTLVGVMGRPGATDSPPATSLPRIFVGLGPLGGSAATGGLVQQASLNGDNVAPWASPPFRTFSNTGPINSSTVFANVDILGTGASRLPPAGATPPTGGFSKFSIDINGRSTFINLVPGHFPDAQSFVNANRSAFLSAAPYSFELDVDDSGRLVITA